MWISHLDNGEFDQGDAGVGNEDLWRVAKYYSGFGTPFVSAALLRGVSLGPFGPWNECQEILMCNETTKRSPEETADISWAATSTYTTL